MNKKAFTLIELVAILALISLIATLTFRVVTNRIKNSQERLYNSLISDLKKAGENYMNDNSEIDRYHLNTMCISIEELQTKNYLDKDVIKNPKNNQVMDGSIKITYNEEINQYEFEYVEQCIKKTVTPFIETILNNEKLKVVANGDGLYETTDSYVFKGNNPNNYFRVGSTYWRIIEIDKTTNIVKMIKLADNQQQWPTKGLSDYLNSEFTTGTSYDSLKEYIKTNSKWNTGQTDKLDTALTVKSVEKQSNEFYTIGLLSLGEYLDASLDKNCYRTNNCTSYLTTSKKYWLANPKDGNQQWYVDGSAVKGSIVPATQMMHIYPTIQLIPSTSVSGTGTEADPYMLAE